MSNKTQGCKVFSCLLDSKKWKFKQNSILPHQICKDHKTVIPSGGKDLTKHAPVYLLVLEMEACTTHTLRVASLKIYISCNPAIQFLGIYLTNN